MIEQRLAALTSTLETRQPPAASDNSEYLENALRTLSERLDRIPAGNDNASAFAHLEQRVSYLLERLEASGDRSAAPAVDLGRVEEGLHDILRSLERQHASLVALADSNRNSADTAQPVDSGIVDLVKRELSDIRFSQSETDRRTQDSLETVHSTLGHVVDRLSTIEGDLRTVRTAPPAAPQSSPPPIEVLEEAPRLMTPLQTWPQQSKPELPNPAALQASPQEHFAAAPREFHAAQPGRADCPAIAAASDQRNPGAACRARRVPRLRRNCRRIIRSSRAPGRPRACPRRQNGSRLPKTRSAKSLPGRRSRSVRRASLPPHAAPRRPQPPRRRPKRRDVRQRRPRPRTRAATRPRRGRQGRLERYLQDPLAAGRRERGRDRARHVQDGDDAARHRQRPATADDGAVRRTGRTGAVSRACGEQHQARKPAAPAPLMISPTPVEKQSNNSSAPNTLDSARIVIPPQAAPPPAAATDITGAITTMPGHRRQACHDRRAVDRAAA